MLELYTRNGYDLSVGSNVIVLEKTQSSNYRYNYTEVANRIKRTKTPVGAGQAVTAAK